MGLIKAALASAGGVLGDQWKEYFYCDALPETVLAVKGQKKVSSRSSNRGNDNIITNGSVIAVADGQCMLIVDQGKVAEICAEAGEFVYDASTEPSVFSGALGQSVKDTFATMGRRFTFGGDTAKDQRVYSINTKELFGNKYGTPTPVPFRVVDEDIGFRTTVSIRCFGEYSYRVCDPILFYKNVCGNVDGQFGRDRLDSMLRSELMTALQPAFGKISTMGIGYTELPLHTMDIANALNEVLSAQWRQKRGIEIVSFGVSSVSATEEDEKRLKAMQQSAFLGGGNAAAGRMVDATANAMEAAAKNTATGPMMAFAGMNMAGSAGTGNMQGLFQQNVGSAYQTPASRAPAAPEPGADTWTCPGCGTKATGNFCPECGSKKPQEGWKCSCGATNKGKFCTQCGAKKPAAEPLYRCDKCGWEPEDPKHPPKFCPECGDPFTDADAIS